MPKPDSDKLKKLLSVKFGWVCWYCGLDIKYKERHLDHIVPKSKGGGDELTNLALTCSFCNMAKHDKSLDEFMGWLNQVRNNEIKPLIKEDGPHPMSGLWQDPEN